MITAFTTILLITSSKKVVLPRSVGWFLARIAQKVIFWKGRLWNNKRLIRLCFCLLFIMTVYFFEF